MHFPPFLSNNENANNKSIGWNNDNLTTGNGGRTRRFQMLVELKENSCRNLPNYENAEVSSKERGRFLSFKQECTQSCTISWNQRWEESCSTNISKSKR